MNISETSTAMTQNQLQQEVGTRVLRMSMDDTEQQAQEITEMARESGEATQQDREATGGQITVQDDQLGNRIDITI